MYAISANLLLSFALRIIFNLFKGPDINLLKPDKFLSVDLFFAAVNAGGFLYLVSQDYTVLLNEAKKDVLDGIIVLILTMAWIRFFVLFLVIPSVSKMLLTLVAMLVDVGPFAFIMGAYMLIATQIFSTQY
mmetsp:Transcript_13250/g.20719  ORF Transcript_13250/g.20719 Transcript_13250/m.20719 type:complete len:131 (+) Transcript_13250:2515-2907(+)